MKVYTRIPWLKTAWCEQFSDIDFNCNQNNADVTYIRGDWDKKHPWNEQEKTVYTLNRLKPTTRLSAQDRFSCCKDDLMNLDPVKNFIFANNDFCKDPKIIVTPHGFLPKAFISRTDAYWLHDNYDNKDYHNKVYWKGRFNHPFRHQFFNFYKKLRDPRFTLEKLRDRVYKGTVYENYRNYINTLQHSDMNFCIRGTYDSIFSFMDTIRCGCIPILINCMLDKGWENIFNDPEDFCLRFDMNKDRIEYVHEKITQVLNDKERVLFMKSNVRKFYHMFMFKHGKIQAEHAWINFTLAKCIEISNNNFNCEKITNQFISSEILNLLDIPGKL